jgi:hypothetical protein
MSPSSVQVDLGHGTASYHATNLAVEDYGNLANAFFDGTSVPATVSFTLQWQMLTVTNRKQMKVRDAVQGFAGEFWESEEAGAATLAWSASEPGFSFQSDPAAASQSYYAELGHERNGAFFPQGTSLQTARTMPYSRAQEFPVAAAFRGSRGSGRVPSHRVS